MNFSEILKYLKALYKRRYLFLAVSLLVMTGVTAYTYTMPEKYKADSTVFIETSVINELVKGLAITPDMNERIKVLRFAMLSRDLIGKVLQTLELDHPGKTITEMQARTQINVRGKELFTVSIVDADPKFAQTYINTLVSRYVEENISGKREETYGASRFLDEQLVHFKQKLDEAEDAIIRFRREQGVDLSPSEESLLADLHQYRREIENIDLTIDTQRSRIAALQGQLKSLDPTVSIFSEQQKEDRLARVEERIRHLLLTYTENYPEVVRLRIEAEALRNRMQEEEKPAAVPVTAEMSTVNPLHQSTSQNLMAAQAEISSLEGRRARLQQMMAERERELQNVPENKKAMGMLVQERDSLKGIYQDLLRRMGQSEVSRQMEIGDKTTTFRIVDPAVFPNHPVSPDRVKMILLAIVAGLGAGAGLVILLENTSSSVRRPEQITDLGIDILASIPRMRDEVQVRKIRRRDVVVFLLGGLWFSGIVGLLGWEVLQKMS